MELILPIIEFVFAFYIDNLYSVYLYKNLFKLEIQLESKVIQDLNDEKDIKDISKGLKNDSSKIGILDGINNKYVIDNDYNGNNGDNVDIKSWRQHHGQKQTPETPQNQNISPDYKSVNRKSKVTHPCFLKLKENIINKDVKKLISYKEKRKTKVIIKTLERFCYLNCCCNNNNNKNNNLRYELINL